MSEKEFARIDYQLCAIANKLSQIPYLPLNLKQEKEKFFNSDNYNPVFHYPKSNACLDNIKKSLLSIEINPVSIGILFKRKQLELLKIIEMMQYIGDRKFTQISKELYGVPSDELVQKAWQLLGLHDSPDQMYISSTQAKVHLKIAMKKYGFNWDVQEKEMASKACVSNKSRILFIKKDSFLTRKFLNRIIVHEIGTHILRYENGLQQPYKIFSLGLTGYLGTEEGLAVLNEERNNCLTKATLKTYAARVIAVHKALKCNFRETYNYILPYVGKDNAFDVTLRVKRGLGNTFFPGAFTKDYLYFKGYFEVKKYIQNHGELIKLYYGKIPIKDLEIIEKIPGLINPMFMGKMKYYTKNFNYKK
jgi:uncharacterized protein (TIGR02421 family)